MRTHYPRTRHLPWSPGATADDLRVTDLSGLRARGRGDREARRREHHAVRRRPARPLTRLRAPPLPYLGQGAPGPYRPRRSGGLAGVRGEHVRPAFDRVRRPGQLVLRLLGVGRGRALPGLGPDGGVSARTRAPRAARAVAGRVRRAGAARAAAGSRTAGGVRRPGRGRLRRGGVRRPRRQVGAGRARTDGHALDARGRRRERAGRAGPAVGGAFRGARRRRRAGGGRRAAR